MIKVKAKKKGAGAKVAVTLLGPSKDIIDEAVAIVLQLPKRLNDIDHGMFELFVDTLKIQLTDDVEDEDDEEANNEE